ncbi:MAG TPA: plastocyanin/azurin family copper-binding protein [Thermoleophilaceae bacterium]|nr:plastocyanin/azurin family copper-binding protein [Thermoleophilaceae bacterium]
MKKSWLVPFLACLVLGLAVAGCGDDDDGDSGGSAATTEQTTTSEQAGGSGDKAATTATAEIIDNDYDPRDITVAKGATVTWTNTGQLPHTVTKDAGPGPDFDSGTVDPNGTFEQTFDTAGEIEYFCTIHSGQRGTVTVE